MGIFDVSLDDVNSGAIGNKKRPSPVPKSPSIGIASPPISSPNVIASPQASISASVPAALDAGMVTPGSPTPAMPTPSGIAQNTAVNPNPNPAPATMADLPRPVGQPQVMRSQQAAPQVAQPAAYQPGQPTDPDTDGRRQYSAGYGESFASRGGAQMGPAGPSNGPASTALDPVQQQGIAALPTTSPAEAARIRAAHQAILDSSPSAAKTQAAANANEVDLSGRQGAYMIENNLRSFEDKGNSVVRQVGADGKTMFTNVGTGDVTDPTKKIQVNSYNGAADNESMAKANAIRQSIIDRQPQGGIAILGDGGIEAANEEKTRRWAMEDAVRKAPESQRAALMIAAMNHDQTNQTTRRGQDMSSATAAANTGVATRGQDLNAQSDANRLAGNPQENQLKSAQAKGIMAQNDSTAMIAEIQKKAAAGDAQAMATYRALTGKAADNRFTAHVVGGGVNETGQAQPQYLGVTGPDGKVQFHKPGQQAAATSKVEVQAALASGKISKEEITKRLTGAGLNPKEYGL